MAEILLETVEEILGEVRDDIRGRWWVEAARTGGRVYSGNVGASLPHSKLGASRRLRIWTISRRSPAVTWFVPIWFWAGFRGCTRWLRGLG